MPPKKINEIKREVHELDENRPRRTLGAREKLQKRKDELKFQRVGRHQQNSNSTLSQRITLQLTEVAFQTAFDQFEKEVGSGQLNSLKREKKFLELLPWIRALDECISELETPLLIEEFGMIEAKRISNTLKTKIGLSYLLNQNYEMARAYMTDAWNGGHFFAAHNLVKLEQSSKDYPKFVEAMLRVLDASYQDNNMALVRQAHINLKQYAHTILDYYLKTAVAEKELSEFIKKHILHLGSQGYVEAINAYKDIPNKTKICMIWKKDMLNYLKSQPDRQDSTERSNIPKLVLDLTNYYFSISEYLKGFRIIKENSQVISSYARAEFANILFSVSHDLSDEVLKQAYVWLKEGILEEIQAIQQPNPNSAAFSSFEQIVLCYFTVFNEINHKKFFDKKLTSQVIEMTCKLEITQIASTTKAHAHFLYGKLWDAGDDDTIEPNDALAFKHYELAANLGHAIALQDLAAMYEHGQGIAPDCDKALHYYQAAYEKKNYIAGIYYASLNINKHKSAKDLNTHLTAGITILKEIEVLLDKQSIKHPVAIADMEQLKSQIAYYRAKFYLMYNQSFSSTIELDSILAVCGELSNSNPYATEIIQSLLQARNYQNKGALSDVLLVLSTMYFSGLYVKKDLQEGEHCFQQLIELNEEPWIQSYYLKTLSSYFQDQYEIEKNQEVKKYLQSKALGYKLQSMECMGDNLLSECIDQVMSTSEPKTTSNGLHLSFFPLANSIQQAYNHDLNKRSINSLQSLLQKKNAEYSWQDVLDATKYIEVLGETFFNNSALFPKLTAMVTYLVTNQLTLDTDGCLAILAAVGKWHLVDASAALDPLLMTLLMRSKDFNFTQWSITLKAIAQLNLPIEIQEKRIMPLLTGLNKFSVKEFSDFVGNIPSSTSNLSRFIYGIALLDARLPSQKSAALAQYSFQKLNRLNKDALVQAESYEISQCYHAHYYFKLKYPAMNWVLNKSIQDLLVNHSDSLALNSGISPSKKQQKIYERLLGFNRTFQQEVFIPEAGRRVDFLYALESTDHQDDGVKNLLVIQYDGAAQHCCFNDEGEIVASSARDVLCKETLRLVCKVVTISRKEWQDVEHDIELQINLLRKKLPNLCKEFMALSPKKSLQTTEVPEVKLNTQGFYKEKPTGQRDSVKHCTEFKSTAPKMAGNRDASG